MIGRAPGFCHPLETVRLVFPFPTGEDTGEEANAREDLMSLALDTVKTNTYVRDL